MQTIEFSDSYLELVFRVTDPLRIDGRTPIKIVREVTPYHAPKSLQPAMKTVERELALWTWKAPDDYRMTSLLVLNSTKQCATRNFFVKPYYAWLASVTCVCQGEDRSKYRRNCA